MTAIAQPVDTRMRPSAAQNARWAISDALVITRRNLLVWMRVPAYLVFTVVQPVIFVLLFRYVFGGAIHAPGTGGYVNYLMPGIIGQTAAFATFATAIALAQEAKKGVIDRFRAMPMARSAVLAGRLIADSIRMLIVILVIVGVGTRWVSASRTASPAPWAWCCSPRLLASPCVPCRRSSGLPSRTRNQCRPSA
jgi:hypothetical protein